MTIRTDYNEGQLGAFTGLPMERYQKAPGISKSALDKIAVSPIDFDRWQRGQAVTEQTDAMEYGTLLHEAVFEDRYHVHVKPEFYGPDDKPWNGNATLCKEWIASHNDRPVVSPAKYRDLRHAALYVRTHPLCLGLLAGGVAELSCFVEAGLKGRMDYVIPGEEFYTVVDLKSTTDASTEAFAKTIASRRYHVQAAMYRRILKALGAPDVRFYFIALETGGLPKVNVRELNQRALDLGDDVLDADLEKLAECRANNRWPEWRDNDGLAGIMQIDLPEWAYPLEELTGMTPATAA